MGKATLFCVLFLAVIATALAACREAKLAAWSDTYSVKGVLHLPFAEIDEPFSAWYDGPNKKSRIDYYDTVKTYQLPTEYQYGTNLKITPVTMSDDKLNVIECLQVNGTSDEGVDIQSILPDTTDFTLSGTQTIDGVDTEVWTLTNVEEEKTNIYTLWITYDGSSPVPVKYEMSGYNTLLGSHYDHYYLDYSDYQTNAIPDGTFDLDTDLTCTSFPGPGLKHLYTFNPMKEFIYPTITSHVESEFQNFKEKHDKSYSDDKEHNLRKEIFRQNVRFIHSHNRQPKGFKLAVNHLADKTENELKALRGKQYTPTYNGGAPFPYTNIKDDDVPETFDWRILGAVTPVEDQAVCGSCWAFGVAGAIEGAYFVKYGNPVIISKQALMDCTWGYGNNGCDGGEDFRVYGWMLDHGGVPIKTDYGNYLGEDGYCHVEGLDLIAPISGFVNVTVNDENALRLAIFKNGPVSVAIDASQPTFSFYSSGVYEEPKCLNGADQLDHAVLAVGYGSLNGQNYWLIRNSWSTHWGNDGYILMSSKDNNCGVMTSPTYPVLT